jgi:outer membrane biosynthesis protein TonB
VALAFRITVSGTTKDIRLLSSPDQSLTDSAIAAVSQWRYQPYLFNGAPIEVGSTAEINFEHP